MCAPTFCHCASCRRSSGAVALPWVTVVADSLQISGDAMRWYASSPAVLRGFCAHCGTPIAYRHHDRHDEVDLTLGSLEDAAAYAPLDHIWMEDALPWDQPADGRQCFARRRDDGSPAA